MLRSQEQKFEIVCVEHLKEVVVMKERSVVLQLSLMGLLYLILPLLFQFCDTLKATQEIIN